MLCALFQQKKKKTVQAWSRLHHLTKITILIKRIYSIRRRAQQLKVAKQREKEWLKAQRSKDRLGNQHMSTYKRHITFEDSVVLLEAAARNDIAEVSGPCF